MDCELLSPQQLPPVGPATIDHEAASRKVGSVA